MSTQTDDRPPATPGERAHERERARTDVRASAEALSALLRQRMPETALTLAASAQLDFPSVETAAEARERNALAHERRSKAWVQGVPKKYLDARVGALGADQHPERLRAWLASTSEVLLLASPTVGNGKTYAAYAVGWAAHEAGEWVCARTAADLMAALRPSGDNEPEIWHTVTRCDLLVIDDLGQDRLTDWTREQLHRLINERNAHGRRTVVTTNLGPREIEDVYGSAIADRLIDEATPIKFTGASRRRPTEW